MLRYHMAVVTPDNRLKREIKRVTSATNSTAQFSSSVSELSDESRANLVIYDARRADPPAELLSSLSADASISYILPSDSLDRKIALMSDERVCSLLCHDDRFDDDEFIASATKSLRGEVFGLQKYFPWGVTTFSMVVRNHDQKSRAIEHVMFYAQQAGVRGLVRERLQLVADELMINALYHAPVDEHGNELYANVDRKELASREDLPPIEVQYGCSGRYFGISIRDGGGSLTRRKVLDYLLRVQRGGAADIENKATGAGLGLQSVLRSVSKLIFNLDPGRSTEVIALFDLELFARGKVGARSVHVFVSPPPEEEEEAFEEPSAEQPAEVVVTQKPGVFKWVAVAVLVAVVAGLGTAVFFNQKYADAQANAPVPELQLESSTATIVFKGKKSKQEIRLGGNESSVQLPPDSYSVTVEGKKPNPGR